MTRKEIEKRCREEMQQNIPDREALWRRIESSLPESSVSQPEKPRFLMTSFRRGLAAAACFLVIITGIKVFNPQKRQDIPNETAMMESAADNMTAKQEGYADEAEADDMSDGESPSVQFSQSFRKKPVAYSDLNVSHEKMTASQVNYDILGTNYEYFNEDAILEKTEYFLDVRVLEGRQDKTTGEMTYQLSIVRVLGGEREGEPENSEITLKSRSAYILEQNHEYVLPLYYQENQGWRLAYACAPQIEKTNDEKLIIPNGFYTLMQGSTTPVLYDSFGKDDYFYDRMYLTGEIYLKLLLAKWENL